MSILDDWEAPEEAPDFTSARARLAVRKQRCTATTQAGKRCPSKAIGIEDQRALCVVHLGLARGHKPGLKPREAGA